MKDQERLQQGFSVMWNKISEKIIFLKIRIYELILFYFTNNLLINASYNFYLIILQENFFS